MKDCPVCGATVDGLWCTACGEGAPPEKKDGKPPKLTPRQRAERDRRYNIMRASYQAQGPTSDDLTPQQWANVCRFFPTVAARAKRRPLVTPDDPLWASASMGPMFGRIKQKVEAFVHEREPGEEG